MPSTTAASSSSSLLARRLYRNLLRASQPFTAPSPHAAVLSSLLHRTGIDDHIQDWEAFVAKTPSSPSLSPLTNGDSDSYDVDLARDLTYSYSSRIQQQQQNQQQPRDAASAFGPSPHRPPTHRTHQRLFRRVLREVVAGTGNYNKMVFPSQVGATRLRDVIRREFRGPGGGGGGGDAGGGGTTASALFDDATRRQVAFTALRELNRKLSYYDTLRDYAPDSVMPQQAAYDVSPLPFEPPSSYLRPGVFLVSHPLLRDGFFSKAVVCILEHNSLGSPGSGSQDDGDGDDSTDDDNNNNNNNNKISDGISDAGSDRMAKRSVVQSQTTSIPGQTYGLIVNRVSVPEGTVRHWTLREAFQEGTLPGRLADFFGDAPARQGGPVHVALQMLYSVPSSSAAEADEVVSAVGGRLIQAIPRGGQSPALHSDRATYFQGDMVKAMAAVESGTMDRDDISFFVGASTWSAGQLASEIAQGYWIPCRGPPEMALHGICEHEPPDPRPGVGGGDDADADSGGTRPLADLWLSMMTACGEEEAALSHLFVYSEDCEPDEDENGLPCDAFDGDDDDESIY